MTLQTFSINGIPIEDEGLSVADATGFHDIPKRVYPTVQQPLRRGRRVMSSSGVYEPREITFRFTVSPTSFLDRTARLDALARKFAGLVSLTSADAPDRECFGILESTRVTAPGKWFVNPRVVADCAIVCDDPLHYDITPIITSIPAGTRGVLAMGTDDVRRLFITLQGPAVNPVVILRDQAGIEVQRMTLTGTLTGTQWLEIDADKYTIVQQPDGVNVFQLGWLGAGETQFELRAPFGYTLECAQADIVVEHFRSWKS